MMPPPSDDCVPALGFQRYSAEIGSRVVDLSEEINKHIEALREAQAALWTAHNDLMRENDEGKITRPVRKVERALEKAKASCPTIQVPGEK
jgi:hypothetical protein